MFVDVRKEEANTNKIMDGVTAANGSVKQLQIGDCVLDKDNTLSTRFIDNSSF